MTFQDWLGFLRSRLVYRNPVKLSRSLRFYASFIEPGSLCFDIGAHVGDRATVWAKIGARVVALEPQPYLSEYLERKFIRNENVRVMPVAAGAKAGTMRILNSPGNPTLATLSHAWVDEVSAAENFDGITWSEGAEVSVTTLDDLILREGLPDFIKIDVEGFEYEVLQGISQPPPCVSFEFLPASITVAEKCVERLSDFGNYEFNVSVGEEMKFGFDRWMPDTAVLSMFKSLSVTDQSGDVYARQVTC